MDVGIFQHVLTNVLLGDAVGRRQHALLPIKQKRRRVYQGPCQVLCIREAAIGELRFALLGVGPELNETRVELDGLLGGGDGFPSLDES